MKNRKSESKQENKNKKYQTESILRMNTQTNSIMQAIQLKTSIEMSGVHAREMTVGWLAGWSRLFSQLDYVATKSE